VLESGHPVKQNTFCGFLITVHNSLSLGDRSCMKFFVCARWQQNYRRMFEISGRFQFTIAVYSVVMVIYSAASCKSVLLEFN